MSRSRGSPIRSGMQLARARRWSPWHDAAGLLPLAAAVALWVLVLVGVAAPLGEALERLDAQPRAAAPVASGPSPSAVASVTEPPPVSTCR